MADTLDHLEKTLADNYRKELDQEENVWRSLPFFAAALALQLAAIVNLVQYLPHSDDAVSAWIAVPAAATAISTVASLVFIAAAIAPARFKYLAPEPDLVRYAAELDNETDLDPSNDAQKNFKEGLVAQYALATDWNRRINQRRAQRRSIAGLFVLASILSTLILVAVVLYLERSSFLTKVELLKERVMTQARDGDRARGSATGRSTTRDGRGTISKVAPPAMREVTKGWWVLRERQVPVEDVRKEQAKRS